MVFTSIALAESSWPVWLQSWELLVLTKLGWDVSVATALDFGELLLRRLPFPAPLLARLRPLLIHILHQFLLGTPSSASTSQRQSRGGDMM